ncbi:MAG: BatD family protein [Proteobacteria bacterium]|nr:BatD family protein [Pseudomonadota bacterium]
MRGRTSRVASAGAALALWFAVLLQLALATGVAHAASGPDVRVQVQGKQPALVGQQVQIEVTVVAPNFFLSAPPFPTLEVPGAVITMPDDRGVHGVEQEGEQTLATIQKTYVFTAQQAGDFTLPPVKIDFSYHADDGKTAQASLTLPATRIAVQLPAGAAAAGATAGAVMPATPLAIHQSLDRDATQLAAGDALVRTVEVQAANTPAMLIPPPHFEAPSGVRMYVADPVLTDSSGQGGGFAGGRRIERVTYVFEDSGRYTLPAVQLQWLDPQTQKPATAQAPAVTVQVKSGAHAGARIAPELPVGAAPSAPRKPLDWVRLGIWGVALILLAVLAFVVVRMWPRWRQHRAAQAAAHEQSDGVMFERVLGACQANDAKGAHQALLAWCQAHAGAVPQQWAAQLGDAGLAAQLELLQRHLYRSSSDASGAWHGGPCAEALRNAHRRWREQRAAHAPARAWGRPLRALNPFEPGA